MCLPLSLPEAQRRQLKPPNTEANQEQDLKSRFKKQTHFFGLLVIRFLAGF